MQIYKMLIDYNNQGDSPWDAIWYEGDDHELEVLECQMRLEAIWKAPSVKLEERSKHPDVYCFQLYFAITEKVCQLWKSLVKDTVEFLPLSVIGGPRLFVIHPILRADLDKKARVTRQGDRGNISVINNYSFSLDQFREKKHIFSVLQAPGSAARDGGYSFGDILISSEMRDLCINSKLKGVTFQLVWSSE